MVVLPLFALVLYDDDKAPRDIANNMTVYPRGRQMGARTLETGNKAMAVAVSAPTSAQQITMDGVRESRGLTLGTLRPFTGKWGP
jgi:hypothetical protein